MSARHYQPWDGGRKWSESEKHGRGYVRKTERGQTQRLEGWGGEPSLKHFDAEQIENRVQAALEAIQKRQSK